MTPHRLLPALLALLIPLATQAQPAAPAAPAHLAFAVYAAGLNVMVVDSKVDIGRDDYRIDLSYRSAGVFGTLFPVQISSFVQGSWAGGKATPLRFASWGTARGNERRITLDYEGGQPVIRTLVPATESDRDPVPAAMQRDTVDTLSAMAVLVRTVAQTGTCDGTVRIFDGRRVLETESRTIGTEMLRPDYRSTYNGRALRCDMRGRQLAGFQHDADEAEIRRVHVSQAWIAQVVPGQPALPVRIVFETRFFGAATAYLTEMGPAQR